jgi:hypothetical protein
LDFHFISICRQRRSRLLGFLSWNCLCGLPLDSINL